MLVSSIGVISCRWRRGWQWSGDGFGPKSQRMFED
jgi:hypothetical protein